MNRNRNLFGVLLTARFALTIESEQTTRSFIQYIIKKQNKKHLLNGLGKKESERRKGRYMCVGLKVATTKLHNKMRAKQIAIAIL